MNITGKWLVRGGALLVMLGFFMPSMLVSCTALPTASQAISLSQLTNQSMGGQSILYLVLLGALVTIVFAFLPADRTNRLNQYILAQALGLGLGAFSIITTFISLSSQMQQIGFSVKPTLGFFVLVAGYGAATVGIVMQFQENARTGPPFARQEAGLGSPVIKPTLPQMTSGPRLEASHGTMTAAPVPVFDGFMIGRGSQANLPLTDRSISVQHARLRFAQGVWFIQDQSSNGTFVNGEKISATRLNDGDQIRVGDTTFIFRA